jgi:hypothetical protein
MSGCTLVVLSRAVEIQTQTPLKIERNAYVHFLACKRFLMKAMEFFSRRTVRVGGLILLTFICVAAIAIASGRYEIKLLPPNNWRFGTYPINLLIDGEHGVRRTIPEGTSTDLGVIEINKFNSRTAEALYGL